MEENNILRVHSGEPRTELQQAYDQIAVLECKIENRELENGSLRNKLWGLVKSYEEVKECLYE